MKTALSVMAVAAAAWALPAEYVEANHELLWGSFKATYGKRYAAADEAARKAIFKANMLKAAAMEQANPRAQYGMTPFSDLSEAEFKVYHSLDVGGKPLPPAPAPLFTDEEVRAAKPVDWRTKGAVTHVKNQGQCGSCWSFSSTGNIEGQHAIATGNLTSLSEQELVSCSNLTHGCGGGWQDDAFEWLQTQQGGKIVTEAAYPYASGKGQTPPCALTPDMPVGATITGHADVPRDEMQMAAWVAAHGPMAVVVDATSWGGYKGGVMEQCFASTPDHAVLVVGFTEDAWIVKNSWGAQWGESGFARVLRNDNECMIAYRPTSAKVGN